jgi:hypothetical protein
MGAETWRHHMTIRTSTETVTFTRPFALSGIVGVQPAGIYTVETDEELLRTSFPAYRKISTVIRLPARPGSTVLAQVVDIDAAELSAALVRDTKPERTTLREEESERQHTYCDSRE